VENYQKKTIIESVVLEVLLLWAENEHPNNEKNLRSESAFFLPF
jgi:hypothetical protein